MKQLFLSTLLTAVVSCYPYQTGSRAEWCETHTCFWAPLAYAADADGAPVVQAALDRISAATGASFTMDELGIPVMFVPRAPVDPSRKSENCGSAEIGYGKLSREVISMDVYISTEVERCGRPVDVVLHEMIHTLTDIDVEHASSGVFSAAVSDDTRLSGESLDILCAGMGGCPLRHDEP